MNILLINTNPVVSRLVALCMREEKIEFEEVEGIGDIKHDRYDIIFIDDLVLTDEAEKVLDFLTVKIKVLLSSSGEEMDIFNIFDWVIKKPFLPSQIYKILHDVQEDDNVEYDENMFKEDMTPADEEDMNDGVEVLDSKEIEKIKALLEMDEDETSEESFDEEEYETRKVEVIKKQLEADGLEIVSEEEYVEKLSNKKKKSKKNKKPKKTLTAKELKKLEKMFAFTIRMSSPKKLRKLLDGDAVKFKLKGKK